MSSPFNFRVQRSTMGAMLAPLWGLLGLALAGHWQSSKAAQPDWNAPAAAQAPIAPAPAAPALRLPGTRGAPRILQPAAPVAEPVTTGGGQAASARKFHGDAPGSDSRAVFALLQQPDGVTAVIGGKTVSAGELRARLRSAVAKTGKARRNVAMRKVELPFNSDHLARQNNELLAGLRQKPSAAELREMKSASVATSDAGVVGSGGKLRTVSQAAADDPTLPCPQRGPSIAVPKGTLTPGGLITFRGGCLGEKPGEVRLYGEFPNGFVRLAVSLWLDDGVAASVPADLAGVMDQDAGIQLVRADGAVSNSRKLAFIARRETQVVPAALISNVRCAPGIGGCIANSAVRVANISDGQATQGDMVGVDEWRLAVGNGWALQGLGFDGLFGDANVSGFERGAAGSASFKVDWQAAKYSTTESRALFYVSESTEQYVSNYTLSILAIGPAGVSPDPAVKPQYAGKSGRHGLREGSGVTTVQDIAGGKAQTPGGTQRGPDWGAAAAAPAAAGGVGPAIHQKALPGSWTKPKPGETVQAPR